MAAAKFQSLSQFRDQLEFQALLLDGSVCESLLRRLDPAAVFRDAVQGEQASTEDLRIFLTELKDARAGEHPLLSRDGLATLMEAQWQVCWKKSIIPKPEPMMKDTEQTHETSASETRPGALVSGPQPSTHSQRREGDAQPGALPHAAVAMPADTQGRQEADIDGNLIPTPSSASPAGQKLRQSTQAISNHPVKEPGQQHPPSNAPEQQLQRQHHHTHDVRTGRYRSEDGQAREHDSSSCQKKSAADASRGGSGELDERMKLSWWANQQQAKAGSLDQSLASALTAQALIRSSPQEDQALLARIMEPDPVRTGVAAPRQSMHQLSPHVLQSEAPKVNDLDAAPSNRHTHRRSGFEQPAAGVLFASKGSDQVGCGKPAALEHAQRLLQQQQVMMKQHEVLLQCLNQPQQQQQQQQHQPQLHQLLHKQQAQTQHQHQHQQQQQKCQQLVGKSDQGNISLSDFKRSMISLVHQDREVEIMWAAIRMEQKDQNPGFDNTQLNNMCWIAAVQVWEFLVNAQQQESREHQTPQRHSAPGGLCPAPPSSLHPVQHDPTHPNSPLTADPRPFHSHPQAAHPQATPPKTTNPQAVYSQAAHPQAVHSQAFHSHAAHPQAAHHQGTPSQQQQLSAPELHPQSLHTVEPASTWPLPPEGRGGCPAALDHLPHPQLHPQPQHALEAPPSQPPLHDPPSPHVPQSHSLASCAACVGCGIGSVSTSARISPQAPPRTTLPQHQHQSVQDRPALGALRAPPSAPVSNSRAIAQDTEHRNNDGGFLIEQHRPGDLPVARSPGGCSSLRLPAATDAMHEGTRKSLQLPLTTTPHSAVAVADAAQALASNRGGSAAVQVNAGASAALHAKPQHTAPRDPGAAAGVATGATTALFHVSQGFRVCSDRPPVATADSAAPGGMATGNTATARDRSGEIGAGPAVNEQSSLCSFAATKAQEEAAGIGASAACKPPSQQEAVPIDAEVAQVPSASRVHACANGGASLQQTPRNVEPAATAEMPANSPGGQFRGTGDSGSARSSPDAVASGAAAPDACSPPAVAPEATHAGTSTADRGGGAGGAVMSGDANAVVDLDVDVPQGEEGGTAGEVGVNASAACMATSAPQAQPADDSATISAVAPSVGSEDISRVRVPESALGRILSRRSRSFYQDHLEPSDACGRAPVSQPRGSESHQHEQVSRSGAEDCIQNVSRSGAEDTQLQHASENPSPAQESQAAAGVSVDLAHSTQEGEEAAGDTLRKVTVDAEVEATHSALAELLHVSELEARTTSKRRGRRGVPGRTRKLRKIAAPRGRRSQKGLVSGIQPRSTEPDICKDSVIELRGHTPGVACDGAGRCFQRHPGTIAFIFRQPKPPSNPTEPQELKLSSVLASSTAAGPGGTHSGASARDAGESLGHTSPVEIRAHPRSLRTLSGAASPHRIHYSHHQHRHHNNNNNDPHAFEAAQLCSDALMGSGEDPHGLASPLRPGSAHPPLFPQHDEHDSGFLRDPLDDPFCRGRCGSPLHPDILDIVPDNFCPTSESPSQGAEEHPDTDFCAASGLHANADLELAELLQFVEDSPSDSEQAAPRTTDAGMIAHSTWPGPAKLTPAEPLGPACDLNAALEPDCSPARPGGGRKRARAGGRGTARERSPKNRVGHLRIEPPDSFSNHPDVESSRLRTISTSNHQDGDDLCTKQNPRCMDNLLGRR